jgi:PAS domain-containing protein
MMVWFKSLFSALAGRRRPALRLAEAVAGLPEAVALFDGEDRLLYCNDAFRRIYRIPADARVRGRSFPAIVYTARLFEIAEEQQRDPRGDDLCDRILAHHCAASGQTLVLPLPDGRRAEIRALRTPDGGTLTTRLEIAGIGHRGEDGTVVDFQSAYLQRRL